MCTADAALAFVRAHRLDTFIEKIHRIVIELEIQLVVAADGRINGRRINSAPLSANASSAGVLSYACTRGKLSAYIPRVVIVITPNLLTYTHSISSNEPEVNLFTTLLITQQLMINRIVTQL